MVKEFIDIIKNFPNQKIIVLGDLILDKYFFGEVTRISSEAPVPVLDIKEIKYVLGGAANTAHNLKALGAQVVLVGLVGPDDEGAAFKNLLEKEGIATSGIFIDEKRKTTVKMRAMVKNQQLLCLGHEDRNSIGPEIENQILDFVKEKIGAVRAILVSDYERGLMTPALAQNIIKLAKENRVLSFIDSKGNDYLKYKDCDAVTMNEKELSRALTSHPIPKGEALLTDLSCNYVLIKRGANGMTVFSKEGGKFSYPAVNKNAVDVSGAGDTALAAFALSLMDGVDCRQAVTLASHACGVVVSKLGTAVASPEELAENLKNNLIL